MASISQRGSKWRAKVRKAGHADQSKSFPTREEAVAWAENLEAQIDSGKPIEREAADVTPISDLVIAYYDNVTHSPDVDADLVQIRTGHIGEMMASDLTKDDVLEWQPERSELSTLLEDVIEYARRELGIRLPSNPVTSAYARPQTMRVRRLAPYEEEQLLAAAEESRGGYLTHAIILSLETALTQSEIVNLEWSQVNLLDNRIVVSNRAGERVVPLTERAAAVLMDREHITSKFRVFKDLTTQALQRAFIRAVERANIHDLHFNDLHHEAIFRMKDKYTLEEVWRISGVQMPSLKRYYGTSNT